MAKGARVISIDAIRTFRSHLCTYIEEASVALTDSHADVQRTVHWIKHDRVRFWQGEIRRRSEKVAQAKSELYRAQLASRDERPSCVIERKALARAEQRLAEAQTKFGNSKKWALELERESMLYRGQCQRFSGALTGDLPRAVALLEQSANRLEEYVQLRAPTTPDVPSEQESVVTETTTRSTPSTSISPYRMLRQFTPDQSVRDDLTMDVPTPTDEKGDLLEDDQGLPAQLGVTCHYVSMSDKVVIDGDALNAQQIYLERSPLRQANDSGWFVGIDRENSPSAESPQYNAITIAQLLEQRPELCEYLSLPPHYLVVLHHQQVIAILNEQDEDHPPTQTT